MKTDEDIVRDLLVRSAPDFEPLDGASMRGTSASTRSLVRRALPAIAAAVVVAAIAGVVVLTRHSASRPVAQGGATVFPPPSPDHTPFRLELVLPGTRFPADGTAIHAQVLAINHTGHAIAKRDPNCDPFVQVGLSGGFVHFDGAMSGDVLCSPAATLAPGVTHIPVTIGTTYQGCQQGRPRGTLVMPHCMGSGDSVIPPLRPGRYRVDVVPQRLSVTPVLSRPVWITLLPR